MKVTRTADRAWFHYLAEKCVASWSIKDGDIEGFRKLLWPHDPVYLVKCRGYFFWVSEEVFNRAVNKRG